MGVMSQDRFPVVETTQVEEAIYHMMVTVGEELIDLNVAYFIWDERGVLIEPGPASVTHLFLDAIQRLGYNPDNLAYIIPTHIHIDHAGGVGAAAQKLPRTKIVIHPSGVRHMVSPERLIASTKMAFGDDFADTYGAILPVPEDQVLAPLDGQRLILENRELRVIYAPGHAPHHITILDSVTGGLFCGEALGIPHGDNQPPMPAAAPPAFDLELYLQTMDMLEKLTPNMLFYSHNGVGREVAELIAQARENSKAYGRIIQEAMKAGETQEQIGQRLVDYVKSQTNLTAYNPGLALMGYFLYFQRKESEREGG
jgi:glyoxylase-like metal-dependent hydrolase (beta-lactamase superfamily II)